jgi:hypothetical protein
VEEKKSRIAPNGVESAVSGAPRILGGRIERRGSTTGRVTFSHSEASLWSGAIAVLDR